MSYNNADRHAKFKHGNTHQHTSHSNTHQHTPFLCDQTGEFIDNL